MKRLEEVKATSECVGFPSRRHQRHQAANL